MTFSPGMRSRQISFKLIVLGHVKTSFFKEAVFDLCLVVRVHMRSLHRPQPMQVYDENELPESAESGNSATPATCGLRASSIS